MATPPEATERPEINVRNTTLNRRVYGQHQFAVSSNGHTTANENKPGFTNARYTSMLERGWREMNTDEFDVKLEGGYRRKTDVIEPNILVLISEYDGPEYQAKLISYEAGSSRFNRNKDTFQFQSLDSTKTWAYTRGELTSENTKVYIKTDPVPFTYKAANARRKTRKQRQKGGFYPSVYSGVAGATMLTPLVARQVMRMYETNTRKTRKRKSKKLLRNKRA
jgi:hypothetical protein